MERAHQLSRFTREATRGLLALALEFEVVVDPQNDALKQFENALGENKIGGAIFHRHFADTDPLVVLDALIGKSKVLKRRKISYPLQKDLVKEFPPMTIIAATLDIDIPQVETSKTKNADEKGRTQMTRSGVMAAAKNSLQTVTKGGLFITAPEGGKEPILKESTIATPAFIISLAQREEIPSFPILIVDLRLDGTNVDYEDEMGLMLNTKYIITPAIVTTSSALWDETNGDPKKIREINKKVFKLMVEAREMSLKLAPLFPEPII